MKAIWNGTVVAESSDTVKVEGNHYFPLESINQSYFQKNDHQTICPWKGTASYYSLRVGDKQNENAAWYYPEPKEGAKEIKNRVAFWKGVEIKD